MSGPPDADGIMRLVWGAAENGGADGSRRGRGEAEAVSLPWNFKRRCAGGIDHIERVVTSMGVTLIFKIAAVGILVSVLSQVLKHSGREEQAFLTSLAGLLLVLFWIIPYVYELFVTMEKLFTL